LSRSRAAINQFVAKHELAWDLTMAALALVYVVLGLFEDHALGPLSVRTVTPFEIGITSIFLAEFALRFYAAPSRAQYLRRHWIDLLALLPSIRYLRFLRLGRLIYLFQAARVLRLGVLVRFLVESNRAANQIRWIAQRNGVHVILLSALGLVVIGGFIVWELEHVTNRSFANFGDSVWWAFATMTTVGSGTQPETVPGRVIGGLIMVLGICCFGLITATVTAHFVHHDRGEQQASPNELMATLQDIQRRLAKLEEVIGSAK
jgi:voltage-gated potassium channel